MEIIVIGRDDHSRYIAKSYEELGVLKKYHTFYYNKRNIISRIIAVFRKNLDKRDRVEIDIKKVDNNIIKHISNKIIRIVLKKRYNVSPIANRVSEELFDLCVSYKIKEADIYHVASQHSYRTIKKIKRKYPNAKVIVDVYAAHPNYRRDIYQKNIINKETKIIMPEEYSITRINKELILADYVLVSSKHVQDSIINENIISKEKITIIPYGADTISFYSYKDKINNKSECIKALYVGQVSAQKGVNYLVEAVEKLNKDNYNIKLTIIGKVEDKRLEDKVKRDNNINYIEYVPNKQLIDYYNSNDMFIFPSLSESFGMVLAEAMACGLPIITTRNASWIIKNDYDGIIIKENNLNDLICSIKYLIMESSKRLELGKNAEKSAKEYSWNQYKENIVRFLEEISEDK